MGTPMSINVREVEQYIRQAAARRGIDPNIAVRVARSEGLAPGVWQSNVVKNGRRETSYGPYQLLVGGGLGDKFRRQTGMDPSDPSSVYAQVDFALDQASQGGWGPWYGAAKVGVGRWDGLRGSRSAGVSARPHEITPEIPEFRGPLPANQIPVPATGFGQANVPMASGGVDPARFGGMAVPFTPDTSMKKYMPGAVAAQEAAPPQLPGTLAPMLGSTEIDPPQPPMPMQGPPMQEPAQGPASMIALANLFGSMGTEQPQFSPVQIRGPSPEQANALASFIEALKKRVV